MKQKVAAVILVAGKGKRINAGRINKTVMTLAGKPMVAYTVENLKKIGLIQILLIVGYAKESVISYFGKRVDYAWQKRCLGTGHALKVGLPSISKKAKFVLVTYGDDSAFYPLKVFKKMIKSCQDQKTAFSFLTLVKKDPSGLGRILRDEEDQVVGIIEEKNATLAQKQTKEINAGTYCFKKEFLEKYLRKIQKNKITGEYYLTDLVNLAVSNKLKVTTVKLPSQDYWFGVNTKEQLVKADKKMKRLLEKTEKSDHQT